MVVIELKKENFAENLSSPSREIDGQSHNLALEESHENEAFQRLQNKKNNQLYHGQILLQEGSMTNFPAAERFRILRAKIERNNLGPKRYHVIAVTSAVPEEGKSVVSVNLARALSIDPVGKTLLIDSDLRKPSVHRFFGLNEGPGLSDALVGDQPLFSVIRSASPRLDVITAGTPLLDPTQAVELPEYKLYLDELRKRYRYIIVDCPPTLLCPEPITISSIVDSVLLVVRAWRTPKQLVEEASDILDRSRIMGVVVNDIIDASRVYDHYGYYGYQIREETAQR